MESQLQVTVRRVTKVTTICVHVCRCVHEFDAFEVKRVTPLPRALKGPNLIA